MGLVRNKDNRTGITYVYESESYWDKEKQQPRSRRRLIGKVDEQTGEIVPTDDRGRKRQLHTETQADTTLASAHTQSKEQIDQLEAIIAQLRAENTKLRKEKETILKKLTDITTQFTA